MTEDVFTQTTSESTALNELVGEGKKFATVEDLAKGKLEADSFIEKLENEARVKADQLVELDKKNDKQQTIADLIEAVKGSNKDTSETSQPAMSQEDLSKLVKTIMDGETVEQTKSTNLAKANQSVLDKLNGDVEAARAYVAERAKTLGTTVEKLQALGEDSPSAFQKLMEIDTSNATSGVTSLPGVTAPSLGAQTIEGHHTKAYYTALKKEMGTANYWRSTKVQAAYTNDAIALGERFNQ